MRVTRCISILCGTAILFTTGSVWAAEDKEKPSKPDSTVERKGDDRDRTHRPGMEGHRPSGFHGGRSSNRPFGREPEAMQRPDQPGHGGPGHGGPGRGGFGQGGSGRGGPGQGGPGRGGPSHGGPGGPGGGPPMGMHPGGPGGPPMGMGPGGSGSSGRFGRGGIPRWPHHNWDSFEQRDPEMFKLLKADVELERKTRELAVQYRQAPDDKKESIEKQLKEVVGEHFQVRQDRRRLELKRLEEELKRLRASMAERDKGREDIVKRRVSQLLGKDTPEF